ncbi:MAG TPA: 2-amino-4-hydroxy-6-hydroxymethyldihydropteridine diphosphokinase [Gammaproteobacteria bacterium]|nr:2-amino-4-hydroxy-6-hydroxymethyldihydropteridine diphosphokinase [Gammaproteobacteria bacterium]
MTKVYVALGSNVEPERHIAMAVQALRGRFGALTLSPIYRNQAIGFEGADFLNAVVGFDSALEVPELKAALDQIERDCGRQRGAARFAPRTLDLDLLLYGQRVDAAAKLPRSEILKYNFMLKPLADIAAAERHPSTGKSYAEHWAEFGGEGGRLTPVILPGL